MAIGICSLGVTAAPAAADPARPTNVASNVTGLTPPTPAVDAELLGAGAFVQLRVRPGTTVVVLGYENEPYLRFGGDGTVAENTRSKATYLNRTLHGTVSIPPTADRNAPPDWRRVGSGGEYAWHDHRVHWMASGTPPEPVDWHVPLEVDGTAVFVDGRYAAVAAPSSMPWWLLAAALFAGTLAIGWRLLRAAAMATLVAAAIGLPIAVASARLPASGAGDWTGVALLGLAGAAAIVNLVTGRGPWLAGAGLALLLWAGHRLDVLDHAVLVTTLPEWHDRLAVAVGVGAGAAAMALGLRLVFGRARHAA